MKNAPNEFSTKNYPNEINILGIKYKIAYVDNPADVDVEKRQTMWGQIDYWTRTIRVFIKDRPKEDIWITILHEMLHGLSNQLRLNLEEKGEANDDETDLVDILANVLFDTLQRNNLLKI